MKKNIFSILLLVLLNGCLDKGSTTENKFNTEFFRYYNYLDSISRHNPLDKSQKSIDAIKYMEENTGIKATTDRNYFGEILFAVEDLAAWKEWYDNEKK